MRDPNEPDYVLINANIWSEKSRKLKPSEMSLIICLFQLVSQINNEKMEFFVSNTELNEIVIKLKNRFKLRTLQCAMRGLVKNDIIIKDNTYNYHLNPLIFKIDCYE